MEALRTAMPDSASADTPRSGDRLPGPRPSAEHPATSTSTSTDATLDRHSGQQSLDNPSTIDAPEQGASNPSPNPPGGSVVDDGLKTPTSTSQSQASLSSLPALATQCPIQPGSGSGYAEATTETSQSEGGGYFQIQANSSPEQSRGPLRSPGLHRSVDSGAPDDLPANSSKDSSTDTIVAPDQPSETTRPTSVPNFQSISLSRRRDGQNHPQYPNQAFSALQQSAQHHGFHARGSSPRQSQHYPTSTSSSTSDLPHLPPGSKTVGNTPAQSPSLFSPLFAAKKVTPDGEDGHYSAPMLHNLHHQAPKETHKLNKDIDPISGRKLVNNYELYYKLGSGQHGTVKLGRNLESGDKVAVKIVRRYSKKVRLGRTGDPNDMIKKEVAIFKKARHPHVVSLFEVIDDEEFSKVYLILEYIERGEIVWRNHTDKALALFEKDRLERERFGGFDEAGFAAAIHQFNSGVPARREEKARLMDEARASGLQVDVQHPRRKHSLADAFWSLEFAGESETESVSEYVSHLSVDTDMRLSRADIHAAETAKQSPQSPTPVHTPRSHPHPMGVEQLTSSQPGSRPDSPNVTEGWTSGRFSDDGKISDLDLRATFDQFLAKQNPWSEEEENYRYVPCLTLQQARDAFRDTVLGLEYLHYQGIMHRDIKPANLLWTGDYRVKISDFGVSYLGKPIREDDRKEDALDNDSAALDEDIELAKTVGTPAFYAPELCDPDFFDTDKRIERPAITGQIDVWALGVTLYGMIFGRLPFYDSNEFRMYEKIAREEVFVSCMRLKGVESPGETPAFHDKRPDDVLQYEEVDDTLQDLLKRLLAKKPSERITLKEVKHHPWVIRGIDDLHGWIEQTDPSRMTEGRKIKPSEEEIKEALVGVLPMFDRLKTGVQNNLQRLGSVFRGRSSRKRTYSNPKTSEYAASTSGPKPRDDRRSSLRGDEQIYSALRASREGSEHPLAQSLAASPEYRPHSQYFSYTPPGSSSGGPEGSEATRAPVSEMVMSTADSVKTLRPHANSQAREVRSAPTTSAGDEDLSNTTSFVDAQLPPTSGIGNILGAPGRLMNNIRSRDRATSRSSPSRSSRSPSVDPSGNREELHAHPSLAISSAMAAGHVDQPAIPREETDVPPPRSSDSSTDAFQRAQEQNWRRHVAEQSRPTAHRRSISMQAPDVACPPSPDDEIFYSRNRPASAADSSLGFPAISSSSDMIVSGDSVTHSRIPSVVSRASSLSAAPEGDMQDALGKQTTVLPAREVHNPARLPTASDSGVELLNSQLPKALVGDEAGYNGEPEDSDSDDEGLAMA